jgi:hypothetical protein
VWIELREGVDRKESDFRGFVAHSRCAATEIAEEEDLINRVRVGRIASPVAVHDGGDKARLDFVPAFLQALLFNILGRRQVHVSPPAG